MKVVIYLRFSDRRDAEKSMSLDTQLSYCLKLCREKGYSVVCNDGVERALDDIRVEHVFSDAGWSGGDEERPGVWQAVTALPKRGIFMAYNQKRIARSVYLEEIIRRRVAEKKGSIEVVEGGHQGDTNEDVMVRQIIAAVNEYERKAMAAQTKAAMLMHQRNGWVMGREPPYGWMGPPVLVTDERGKERKKWSVNPAEKPTQERIMALHIEGLSNEAIASHLNQVNVFPRSGRWNATIIGKIVNRACVS